jgi:hypothetical protein
MQDGVVQAFFERAGLEPGDGIRAVVEVLRSLPYGRPDPPTVEGLVSQWKGTCSTKHALLVRCLAEMEPASNPRLVHRVYTTTPAAAEAMFGADAARAVPHAGLVDVHTYVVATIDGADVALDVTFPGPEWDGVTSMPIAASEGRDILAGPDPVASKAALVREHCDPSVREPFIAALST